MKIGKRIIGPEKPVYVIAEMSSNHLQDFDRAVAIIRAAAKAGADAVKLQTYTPDTMTIKSDRDEFLIKSGPWKGKRLHELYSEAYMPWEWFPDLQVVAAESRVDLFSTAYDESSIRFLMKMNVPVFKIASFELSDTPLIREIGATGKPVIASTGMASLGEIHTALQILRGSGMSNKDIVLLKCVSAYPASPSDMNLETMNHMMGTFGVNVGLSDHTLGTAVPVAAAALGTMVIEKHMTLSRADGGHDAHFSLEPDEFKEMVDAVKTVRDALGHVHYGALSSEESSIVYRRSVFAVKDIAAGDKFTVENVRVIRPGHGLPPVHMARVLASQARVDIKSGTPLEWGMVL